MAISHVGKRPTFLLPYLSAVSRILGFVALAGFCREFEATGTPHRIEVMSTVPQLYHFN